MQRTSFSDMNCPIARALDQVGEWWSLLIIRECTQGSTRFAEFQSALGIAKNVLASRLERLTELGILERFPLQERVNADGYRLTRKGEELYPILVALMQWGDRWATPSGKPSVALVEDKTGQPIEPVVVRAKDGHPLSFHEVRFAPGPGATLNTHKVIADRNEKVLG
jgi:DNA-binding HxlR family transcriptional regulator